jgi:hypothetical protein
MDISEFSRLEDKGRYARHPWEESRKNVLLKLLRKTDLEFPVKRIVDIGSGDAYVIHALQDKNLAAEYFAIDTAYTPQVIKQLRENNPDSNVVYVQDLETYLRDHATTDATLFLCMDVLEHLPDESLILDHLGAGNNHYFFAVPAFQSVFSQHDVLLGHYRRYTRRQLKNLLEQRGFKISRSGYYFTSLLVFRWIDKLLGRDKKASIDNWKGSDAKTDFINAVLSGDFAAGNVFQSLGIRIPGLSCYCQCTK